MAEEGGERQMFFRDKLKLTKLSPDKILPNPSQPRKVKNWFTAATMELTVTGA